MYDRPFATPGPTRKGLVEEMRSPLQRHGSTKCNEEMVPSERIVECVFGEIAEAGELSPVSISRLLALYKLSTLDAALSIVDKGMVQKLVAESGRSLYLVESSGDEPYVCFKHYCPCPYFCMSVINRPEALACKHVLASQIGDAIGKVETLHVSDEEFVDWMMKQENAVVSGSNLHNRTPNKSFRTPRKGSNLT